MEEDDKATGLNQVANKVGQPLTGAAWGKLVADEVHKLTSWPNPTFQQPEKIPLPECPCPHCVQQRATPEHMSSQLQQLHFTMRDLTAQTRTQDKQIAKLEGLVQMLIKALGVNEEFLSDAYRGVV